MNKKKHRTIYYICIFLVFVISTILEITAIERLGVKVYRENGMAFVAAYLLVCLLILYLIVTNYIVIRSGLKFEEQSVTFGRLALSLASDYESVYYLNTEDGSYVEYGVTSEDKGLDILSRGDDFFGDSVINAGRLVYDEDREKFLSVINEKRLLEIFRNKEVIHLDYRLIIDGKPQYYNLKVTHGSGDDDKYIVIGVRNVDAQTRKEEKKEAAIEEGITFGRIAHALASRYEVIYYVDIENDDYEEYASSDSYSQLKVGNKGTDFFGDCQKNMMNFIYSEDIPLMRKTMERDYFMNALNIGGFFSIKYRLVLGGNPEYVELRALKPKDDENHIIIGVLNINDTVLYQHEMEQKLDDVTLLANRDALTGVKNKNAYDEYEKKLNDKINSSEKVEFAVVVCDLNNLKIINDTKGHKAGDEYIREACRIICRVFKHSPVYRIGGDEFVVIMRSEDYENRKALLDGLQESMIINQQERRVVFACGMAVYDSATDDKLVNVFERADKEMYINKKMLKAL